MKPLSLSTIPALNQQFHKIFPSHRLRALWQQVQTQAYHYTLLPAGLLVALWLAYLARASGLRALCERHAPLLGTHNFSSLSPALARPVMAAFAAACRACLEADWTAGAGDLVAVDSMALTLTRTRRHRLAKFNDKTVGGGVIWALVLQAGRGLCPVKVLSMVQGAWSDVRQMGALPRLAVGPVYLLDRGFYGLKLLEQWLLGGVHFIVRVKSASLVYAPLAELSRPRRLSGRLTLEWDGLALLGGAQAKAHPLVRLVVARQEGGEPLILASDQWLWSAERIGEAYRQRWQIERFHKLLKDALGLAHLYSFSQSGLALQIEAVLMLALLLYRSEAGQAEGERVVDVLRQVLRRVRQGLGLDTPWRRNCCTVTHAKKKKKMGKRVWGRAQQNL